MERCNKAKRLTPQMRDTLVMLGTAKKPFSFYKHNKLRSQKRTDRKKQTNLEEPGPSVGKHEQTGRYFGN